MKCSACGNIIKNKCDFCGKKLTAKTTKFNCLGQGKLHTCHVCSGEV